MTDERREYMREYMREYRQKKRSEEIQKGVTISKTGELRVLIPASVVYAK